jgi:heme exporter protein D
MDEVRTFLAMGGYAVYVWPAFAVTTLVLGWLVVDSLRRLRRAEAGLAALGSQGRRSRRPR